MLANERLRPGISDTQQITGRPTSGTTAGEETEATRTREESFTLGPSARDQLNVAANPNGSTDNPETDDGEQS